MNQHVTIIGALFVAFGIIGLFIGSGLFFGLAGIGWISGDADAAIVMSFIATMLGMFFLLISLPSLIAGIGLLRRAKWARIVALIVGALELVNFPFGTLLGIYAIVILTRDDVIAELEGRPVVTQQPTVTPALTE